MSSNKEQAILNKQAKYYLDYIQDCLRFTEVSNWEEMLLESIQNNVSFTNAEVYALHKVYYKLFEKYQDINHHVHLSSLSQFTVPFPSHTSLLSFSE